MLCSWQINVTSADLRDECKDVIVNSLLCSVFEYSGNVDYILSFRVLKQNLSPQVCFKREYFTIAGLSDDLRPPHFFMTLGSTVNYLNTINSSGAFHCVPGYFASWSPTERHQDMSAVLLPCRACAGPQYRPQASLKTTTSTLITPLASLRPPCWIGPQQMGDCKWGGKEI